ncbi:hypothetical protein D3C85_1042060 [compost metagenome]
MACDGLPGPPFEGLGRAFTGGIAGAGCRPRAGRPTSLTRGLGTVLQARLPLAVEALAAGLVRIGRIAAIGGIVLPRGPVIADVVAVQTVVDVDVVVAVDVDVDVAVPPIGVAPHGVDRRDAQAESDAGDQRGREHRPRRRRVVIRGIGRIGPCPIDHGRVVAGHVDHLRVRGFDHDDGLFVFGRGFHRLLRRALQVACLLGLRAQPLDGIHDAVGLRQESVAYGFHPFGLTAHHVHDRREGDQRLDAGIPGFTLDRLDGVVAGLRGVRGRPFGGFRDVVRIGGSHEDLR